MRIFADARTISKKLLLSLRKFDLSEFPLRNSPTLSLRRSWQGTIPESPQAADP